MTLTESPTFPDVDARDRAGSDAVHRRRWAILAVLCLSLFVAVVDNTIVNVAIPTISNRLGASISDLQWIVDAYALGFAGFLLVGGSLGDRFGRKGALQLGLVWFAACSAIAAWAGSTGALIAARAAMGLGAALIFPATLAILTNVFTDRRERAKAIGIWSGVVGLAVALGPISGGFLLEHFWWGSIFLVNVPIAAVALVVGQRLVPSSKDPETPRLDVVGFVLSIMAIVAIVFTMIEAPKWGWASAKSIVGFATGVGVGIGFVAWERRSAHPMMDVTVFRNGPFSAASFSVTAAFFALFGFIFLITQYFQFVKGYNTLSAGVHTLPFAIATGSTAPISPLVARRFGRRATVGGGLALMSIGFVIASTLRTESAYWGPVIISMICIAAGLGLVTAPSTDVILASLPPEKAGVGSAINDVTRELGGVLGVAVVGSVFSSVYGPRIAERLAALGQVPGEAIAVSEQSVAAALAVSEQAPAAARPTLVAIARSAFGDGLGAGSLVCAGAVALGAVLVAVLLRGAASSSDAG